MKMKSIIKKVLKEDTQTFKPPQGVASAAQRALDARKKHGDKVKGGTRVGWTRANQLANREPVSLETVRRMHSFFSRHDGNQKVDSENEDFKWADNGYTAWQIWGGNAGKRWAKEIVDRHKDD